MGIIKESVSEIAKVGPMGDSAIGMKHRGKHLVAGNFSVGSGYVTDRGFFGHAKVNKQDIVKNPPPQPSQFGKDGFYSNVQNCEGKL